MAASFIPQYRSQFSWGSSETDKTATSSSPSWTSVREHRKSETSTLVTPPPSPSQGLFPTESRYGKQSLHVSGLPGPDVARTSSLRSLSLFALRKRSPTATDNAVQHYKPSTRSVKASLSRRELRVGPPIPPRPLRRLFQRTLLEADSETASTCTSTCLPHKGGSDHQTTSPQPWTHAPNGETRPVQRLGDLNRDEGGTAFARIHPDGWNKLVPKQWVEDDSGSHDVDTAGSRSVYSQIESEAGHGVEGEADHVKWKKSHSDGLQAAPIRTFDCLVSIKQQPAPALRGSLATSPPQPAQRTHAYKDTSEQSRAYFHAPLDILARRRCDDGEESRVRYTFDELYVWDHDSGHDSGLDLGRDRDPGHGRSKTPDHGPARQRQRQRQRPEKLQPASGKPDQNEHKTEQEEQEALIPSPLRLRRSKAKKSADLAPPPSRRSSWSSILYLSEFDGEGEPVEETHSPSTTAYRVNKSTDAGGAGDRIDQTPQSHRICTDPAICTDRSEDADADADAGAHGGSGTESDIDKILDLYLYCCESKSTEGGESMALAQSEAEAPGPATCSSWANRRRGDHPTKVAKHGDMAVKRDVHVDVDVNVNATRDTDSSLTSSISKALASRYMTSPGSSTTKGGNAGGGGPLHMRIHTLTMILTMHTILYTYPPVQKGVQAQARTYVRNLTWIQTTRHAENKC